MSLVTSSSAIIFIATEVSPIIITAGAKFEPTHVGCYGEMDVGEQ
jgi:hypothetical protein